MDAVQYWWETPNAGWHRVTVPIVAATASVRVYTGTAGRYSRVRAVSVSFGVTSTSGTLDIEKTPSGTAAGSGTSQLTGTMSLAGTANIPVAGVVKTEPDLIGPTDAVSVVLAGDKTGLVGGNVTIWLEQVPAGIV